MSRYRIFRNTRLQKTFLGVSPWELLPLWVGSVLALIIFFSSISYAVIWAFISVYTGHMLSKAYHKHRSNSLPKEKEAFLYRLGFGPFGRGLDGKKKIFTGTSHQKNLKVRK